MEGSLKGSNGNNDGIFEDDNPREGYINNEDQLKGVGWKLEG